MPAESSRRSPPLQVQLLELFQMCVQCFTSSADRSEPHSGTITGFTSSYFPLFPPSFSSVRLTAPVVLTCDGMFGLPEAGMHTHSCTTQHTKPFSHWWNLQRIKERKGGERHSMCVYTRDTEWSCTDPLHRRHRL